MRMAPVRGFFRTCMNRNLPFGYNPRYLRPTFAIPGGQRLTKWTRTSSDTTTLDGNPTFAAPEVPDAQRISNHLSRLFYADANKL